MVLVAVSVPVPLRAVTVVVSQLPVGRCAACLVGAVEPQLASVWQAETEVGR